MARHFLAGDCSKDGSVHNKTPFSIRIELFGSSYASLNIILSFIPLTENGCKNTAESSPRHSLLSAVSTYYESYLKTAHAIMRSNPPIVICAHIQLGGFNLANNHTFKFLSGLLVQTLCKKNIAP